jgi:hypothetical protein
VIDDSEVVGILADFIAEALDSADPSRQQEALAISERLAWKMKSLEEHQDFIRDCCAVFVEPHLALLSLFNATWKIRFWQQLDEPLKSLLQDCDLDIISEGGERSLLICCPNTQTVTQLYESLFLLSCSTYDFTGYLKQVYLTAPAPNP